MVRFYRDERGDHRGRKLSTILSRSTEWLEYTHDYIQWLFPLAVPSAFNPDAPILSSSDIQEFYSDRVLRSTLRDALNVMLDFYGLLLVARTEACMQVIKDSSFETRAQSWLTPGNHNFLRITRILKSLCLLGLPEHAQALFECLNLIYKEHGGVVGAETFEFWRRAVR